MAEPQFLLSAAAQWLDLVVLQDEIAVWAQQVIGHQVSVVG